MNRFYNVRLSHKTDQEYVEMISAVLNDSDGFYNRYRSITPKDSSLEIACGLIDKSDIKKYNNFLCEIYFDKNCHDITVELCYIYDPDNNKTLYYDNVDKSSLGYFIDWLVYQMNRYLGFKQEFAF